jgi:hypothetical protein
MLFVGVCGGVNAARVCGRGEGGDHDSNGIKCKACRLPVWPSHQCPWDVSGKAVESVFTVCRVDSDSLLACSLLVNNQPCTSVSLAIFTCPLASSTHHFPDALTAPCPSPCHLLLPRRHPGQAPWPHPVCW